MTSAPVRALRRVRSALTPAITLVHHAAYRLPLGLADPRRADRILHHLLAEGLVLGRDVKAARPATLPELLRVHSAAYLGSLQEPGAVDRVLGGMGLRDEAGMVDVQRLQTGGTVVAARQAVKRGGLVVNLGGGFHHAHRGQGGGFCLFHDVAVAIAALRVDGWSGRALIIDLDQHPGDGTRALFAHDPDVFTWSLHAAHWGELDPAVAAEDMALGPGLTDGPFLEALREGLPRILATHRPDLVFYVAGVDGSREDPVGNWLLSPQTFVERDTFVVEQVGDRPLVWTLAGGYGPDAWRHTARPLAVLCRGPDQPLRTIAETELDRFRVVARRLDTEQLSGRDDWGITWEDVMGELDGAGPSRFLDYYTAFGIELALQEYGVLDPLRTRGFERLQVTIDPRHATGHLARLHALDGEAPELLMELVVRKTTAWAPWQLLYVEWLLLQNPRQAPTRPLLPGQTHPGLGSLSEVVGMLMMSAERLKLDGLAFRPAHYHVAAMGRAWSQFVDPALEARFAATRQAVESLSLAAATEAIEADRLRDTSNGVVKWASEPMVVPVSPGMKAAFASDERERAIAAAGVDMRLVEPG